MKPEDKATLERECKLFQHSIGMQATAKECAPYTVTGSYVDSNGCMKTHGRGNESSFIQTTQYTAVSLGNL